MFLCIVGGAGSTVNDKQSLREVCVSSICSGGGFRCSLPFPLPFSFGSEALEWPPRKSDKGNNWDYPQQAYPHLLQGILLENPSNCLSSGCLGTVKKIN